MSQLLEGGVDTRKLEIYQRALLIQHSLFEGPDFIMVTLDNILAYAMEDNLTNPDLVSATSTVTVSTESHVVLWWHVHNKRK
jgi:hypothetical protein